MVTVSQKPEVPRHHHACPYVPRPVPYLQPTFAEDSINHTALYLKGSQALLSRVRWKDVGGASLRPFGFPVDSLCFHRYRGTQVHDLQHRLRGEIPHFDLVDERCLQRLLKSLSISHSFSQPNYYRAFLRGPDFPDFDS